MNFLRLFPIVFSFILMAAHFSRSGLYPLVILSLLFPLLLLIKRKWVVRTIQGVLVLGAIEWCITMMRYIEIRKSLGDDWIRLAIILSVVALFTALSGLVFNGKQLKKRYRN